MTTDQSQWASYSGPPPDMRDNCRDFEEVQARLRTGHYHRQHVEDYRGFANFTIQELASGSDLGFIYDSSRNMFIFPDGREIPVEGYGRR